MASSHDAFGTDGPRHVLPIRTPLQPESLSDLLAAIVAGVTVDRRHRHLPAVTISLDVMASWAPDVDAEALRASLTHLVAAACEAAAGPAPASDGPCLREVVITAVDTPRGLEIEVANSGAGPDSLAQVGLTAARSFAQHMGGSLDVTACPEGGAAVTLGFPSRRVARSVRPAA